MNSPRSLARAQWILRVVLAVQGTGLAMQLLWGSFEVESDIYGLLYFDWEWPEELAIRIEDIGTITYFAAGLTVLTAPLIISIVRNLVWKSKDPMLDTVFNGSLSFQIVSAAIMVTCCLLFIFLWQGAIATLHAYRGGSFMAEWAIATHAVRIFAPLALIALLFTSSQAKRETRYPIVGDWILRLAIVATFVTHGVEAIRLNPAFTDLLIGSADNLLGLTLSQSVTNIMLYIIGAIDIVLAGLLIFTRWRCVPAYLAFWGFVTAFSRITAAGFVGFAAAYPETLIRAANGGAPLALLILCWVPARPQSNLSHPPSSQEESDDT